MTPRADDLAHLDKLTALAADLVDHMEHSLEAAMPKRRSYSSPPPQKRHTDQQRPSRGTTALAESDTPTRSGRQYTETPEVD
jgi:hypothetical protein